MHYTAYEEMAPNFPIRLGNRTSKTTTAIHRDFSRTRKAS